MFSKAFKGELGLAETFWKFGILGIVILGGLVSYFAKMLNSYLQGRTVYDFFMHGFHFIYSSKLSILWTLCYYSCALSLVLYACYISKGVWKSAAAYEKSSFLALSARFAIILTTSFYLYTMPIVRLF